MSSMSGGGASGWGKALAVIALSRSALPASSASIASGVKTVRVRRSVRIVGSVIAACFSGERPWRTFVSGQVYALEVHRDHLHQDHVAAHAGRAARCRSATTSARPSSARSRSASSRTGGSASGARSRSRSRASTCSVEIGVESLIVVRDRKGTVRALYNVCRHRGTRLCEAPRGELSETIQCPYHAWTYGLDGRLIGVPDQRELEGFDKADYPLIQAHVALWEGFLFINLAEEPEPFAEAFAPLLGRVGKWNLRGPQGGSALRVRREGQLEAAVPELLRVLSLLAAASVAGEALAAHQRRERPHRRADPRRVHDHHGAGRQPDAEWPVLRRPGGRPLRRTIASACTTTRSFPTCC